LSVPLGKRQAHAAMRQAELMLARDRAILHEQERAIVQSLSNAISDVDRAYAVLQTTYNRRHAAHQEVAAVQAAYESDNATVDLLLEAQRRQAEADGSYYRSLVEYSLAIKNVQFEKGSLLAYNNIYLAEGGWPEKAYIDAAERDRLRGRVRKIVDAPEYTGALSRGDYPQLLTPGEVPTEPMQPTPESAEPTPEPVTDKLVPPAVPGVTQNGSGDAQFIQSIDFDETPGTEKAIQNLEGTSQETEPEAYFAPRATVPPGPEAGFNPLPATEPQAAAVTLPAQNQFEANPPMSVVPDTTPTLRSALQNQTLKFPLKDHSGSQDPFKDYRNAGPRWEPVPIPETKQRNLRDFSGEVKRFPLKETN
ncbi:MAG: TolC family protein, partial [Planctomycetaceae bacterium]|nr:TolC family protein [Planctomycetaceae bacterium]